MKQLICILFFSFTIVAFSQEKTTTLYLIRHAEKADNSTDPELSEVVKERALKWGSYFKDKNISSYYVSLNKRTMFTATYASSVMSTEPEPGTSKETNFRTYIPENFSLKQVIADQEGKSVVIVGHSNTIPAQINALLGKNI